MVKVAINGFGRIGRTAFKIALENKDVQVVAINDLADTKTLAHLLKHDSNYGAYGKNVSEDGKNIIVDGKKYPAIAERDPQKLPWKQYGVEVVLECTGAFTKYDEAKKHLDAGAKSVIISAPAKGEDAKTYVLSVNDDKYTGEKVISNASCTTNCISPVMAVLNDKFGVKKAMMTTVHGYTSDQRLHDAPHKDLRRARAAAENIVPTTTGAAVATTEAIPSLKGLFDGMSLRVPVPVVSISDITAVLGKKVTVEQVNKAFKDAAKEKKYAGILAVTEEQLVSHDFIGSSYSAIVDLPLTQVVDGDMVKVFAWYDNEWSYSCRLVEQAVHVGKQLK